MWRFSPVFQQSCVPGGIGDPDFRIAKYYLKLKINRGTSSSP
jgi:hypothetical protein